MAIELDLFQVTNDIGQVAPADIAVDVLTSDRPDSLSLLVKDYLNSFASRGYSKAKVEYSTTPVALGFTTVQYSALIIATKIK